MTRIYKTIEKIQQVQKLVETRCDRCGIIIPETKGFETKIFELDYSTGYAFSSDATSGSGWCVEDLCDACVGWLRVLLEANGVKIKEYDY